MTSSRLDLSRRRVVVALACATVAVVFLVSSFGTVAAAPAPPASASESFDGTAGLIAPSFAARAGYSSAYPVEVEDATPASETTPVDVTFQTPLSAADYAAAVAYFRGEGVGVISTDPYRIFLGLSGPAVAVGRAFSTELMQATYGGTPVVFPSDPPSLPSPLRSEIAGVVGLSSGFGRFSFALAPPPGERSLAGSTSPADANTMTPALARYLYNLSALYNLSGGYHGATYPVGTSIAVVLWGEGYAPSDVESFFSNSQYYWSSFPQPNIVPYPVDGAMSPSNGAVDSPDAKAVEELTLDIEWAGSIAPGATIDAVYAPDGSASSGYSPTNVALTDAFETALKLNVSVISMSFGTIEASDSGLVSAWAPLLNEAASQGTTVLAATGDSGGDTSDTPACSGTLGPEYPASSPQVVAVGGTDVAILRSVLGQVTFTETAWNGSGGGFSSQFAAPSWQEVGTAKGPVGANGHRGMPDVSATAADNFLYFNGSATAAAGTSFATPLWGGLVATIDAKWGQRLGFFTPSLYHVGSVEPTGAVGDGLALVTSGSNCVATAGDGWSAVTGWGSPRADVLYADLLGSFVNITLDVDRTTVAPGGSVSVAAQLTNRTSGAPLAHVEFNLSFAADTDIGPCTGTFASAALTTNATGWVSGSFSVPLCYLGQHAVISALVNTTKLYGSDDLRVNVNLLGFDPALTFLEQPPWAYVAYSVIVGSASVAGVWLGRPREPPVRQVRAARPPPGVVSPPPPPPPPSPPSGPPPSIPSPETPPPPPPSAPPMPPQGGGPSPPSVGAP